MQNETWIGIPKNWPVQPSARLQGMDTPLEIAISHVEVELYRCAFEATGSEKIEVQTAFQYAKTLERFGKFGKAVKGVLVVGDVDQGLVEQFMGAVGVEGLPPPGATRSARLSALRFFTRFLLDLRCIESDPTRGLSAGRRRVPRTALRLGEEELESVKAASLVTLAETRLPGRHRNR